MRVKKTYLLNSGNNCCPLLTIKWNKKSTLITNDNTKNQRSGRYVSRLKMHISCVIEKSIIIYFRTEIVSKTNAKLTLF
ncbi:hypothetical protein TSAR_013392 [Trichomalopsis sarcophagae]|uniref:Uncharacterized protein n=1 Tax=Trichomalopsis sarcophagae TaxID=543379 RepID=A0A232EG74_9HYME|nr:hypothetical protein TSAR_013392 [Trichomalopsis sarcophagae]